MIERVGRPGAREPHRGGDDTVKAVEKRLGDLQMPSHVNESGARTSPELMERLKKRFDLPEPITSKKGWPKVAAVLARKVLAKQKKNP